MATRHTRLVQVRNNNIEQSPTILSGESDAHGNVALAVVPDAICCCTCRLVIPNGVYPVIQHWGVAEDEQEQPGPKWCWTFPRHIVYLITTKYISYDAPVKHVPTADNVMINIDVFFVFKIGPSLADVNKFCYSLGVSRFDEMLSAMTEETIRTLVLQVNYNQVYDLKESWATEVQQDLQNRFKLFGVEFSSCKIKDVQLPPTFAQALSEATQFDAKLQLQQQNQNSEIQRVTNEQEQLNQEQTRTQERKLEEIRSQVARAQIERDVKLSQAQTELEVAKTNATEQAEIMIAKAVNEKELSKSRAEREANEMILRAQAEAEETKIEAQQKAEVSIKLAEAQFAVANNRANAIVEEAKAEGNAAGNLEAKRRHHLNMARAEVMESLARKGKIIISGQTGDSLLNGMVGITPQQR